MKSSFIAFLACIMSVFEESRVQGHPGLPAPNLHLPKGTGKKGPWTFSKDGLTYTFNSGVSLTGYGSLKNGGSFGIKVGVPIGRRRRSLKVESTIKQGLPPPIGPRTIFPLTFAPLLDEEKEKELPEILQEQLAEPAENKPETAEEKCDECLEIQPFDTKDKRVENETIANNDFVMIVKFIEENISALKLQAKIRFEVVDVVKGPIEKIKPGEKFTINADMAKCPCISVLNAGYYVITGSVNSEDKLVLSNVLMEFE